MTNTMTPDAEGPDPENLDALFRMVFGEPEETTEEETETTADEAAEPMAEWERELLAAAPNGEGPTAALAQMVEAAAEVAGQEYRNADKTGWKRRDFMVTLTVNLGYSYDPASPAAQKSATEEAEQVASMIADAVAASQVYRYADYQEGATLAHGVDLDG